MSNTVVRSPRPLVLTVTLAAALASTAGCSRREAQWGPARGGPEGVIPAGQVPALPGALAAAVSAPPSTMGALPGPVSPLAIGSTHNGTLGPGDIMLPEGKYCDQFVLTLIAGQPITIVARGGPMTSSPGSMMDMYLYLFNQAQELTHDDDSASSGGALNSRIVYTPTTTGPHLIRVTTFGSGVREGSYTLQTYSGALHTQL